MRYRPELIDTLPWRVGLTLGREPSGRVHGGPRFRAGPQKLQRGCSFLASLPFLPSTALLR